MFPGNVDAYVENQRERRLHDERVNAAVLAKRKQLETFIDKNRARASTASQARSKAKQLERLELLEIEMPEATVRIRARKSSRGKGRRPDAWTWRSVIRTTRSRAASTSKSRTARGSLSWATTGKAKRRFCARWSGRSIRSPATCGGGTAARSGLMPSMFTQACRKSGQSKNTCKTARPRPCRFQTILDVAGSFLFRGDLVEKRIAVLSGGERARLCLAGLLLGRHNVLVLDEPGNHLDVDTVEALAEALVDYQGTIVFTSHDRYFMQRVASGVIEVRDGTVANYPGDYSNYVWRIEQEVKEGTRTDQPRSSARRSAPPQRRARRLAHTRSASAK